MLLLLFTLFFKVEVEMTQNFYVSRNTREFNEFSLPWSNNFDFINGCASKLLYKLYIIQLFIELML